MKKQVRLPSHTVPICYEIFLKPDFKTFNFEGKEKIELALDIPIKTITLHAKELKIEAVIFTNTTEKIKAQSIKYDAKKETVTFSFAKLLPVGKGELSLKFNGVLNEHMRGFYRSRYLKDGKECWMATTQFESTDARRAFPCVDEPAAKAVFDVTLMVPDHCTAIPNTFRPKFRSMNPDIK